MVAGHYRKDMVLSRRATGKRSLRVVGKTEGWGAHHGVLLRPMRERKSPVDIDAVHQNPKLGCVCVIMKLSHSSGGCPDYAVRQ